MVTVPLGDSLHPLQCNLNEALLVLFLPPACSLQEGMILTMTMTLATATERTKVQAQPREQQKQHLKVPCGTSTNPRGFSQEEEGRDGRGDS